MPYIGTQPLTGQFKKLDAITVVNGQAAYTMQYNGSNYKPATANALLVSVNGVIQAAGDAYDIDGSTITFTENLVTGDVIDFIIALGDTGSAVTPVDGSVTTAKLANDAVTSDKLAHDIAVQTSLSVPTIKDSSGTNTAISIDSSGRVTLPQLIAFHVYKSNDSNMGATDPVIFNVETTNLGSHYSTSTGRFTAPIAGTYRFESASHRATEDSDAANILIYKNGSTVLSNSYVKNAGRRSRCLVTVIATLAANDYITIATTGDDFWAGDNAGIYFQGQLLG